MYWSLEHQFPNKIAYRSALINGEPGLLRYVDGKIESAQSFVVDGGHIVAVFIVRNPDKLANFALPVTTGGTDSSKEL